MRELPAELIDKPFTPRMAALYGVTARQLQGARVRSLFSGVYVGAHVDVTARVLAGAVKLILPPGAVVSYSTAALFHGADVRRSLDRDVYVTSLREAKIRRPGICSTSAYLEKGDVVVVDDVPITSPVRTAFDLARQRDLIERVVGVDAMLNRGGCDLAELAAYVVDRGWWRGIRWAREALIHAEPKAESPMESKQRMRLILGGLPRPEAQFILLDRAGLFVARLDHGYEKWKVAPEYDGRDHAETWQQDNHRHQHVEDQGWWHRNYTWLSIQNGWDAMVQQVGNALVARGWRP